MKTNFFILYLLLSSFNVFGLNDVPSKPRLTSHIVDQANLFSSSEENKLTSYIKQFYNSSKKTVTILTVESLKGENIEAFSIRVLDAWEKQSYASDLLFLVAKNDRKTRLEVGRDLEGKITDAKAGELLRKLPPYFKNKQFFEGTSMIIYECAKLNGTNINMKRPVRHKQKAKTITDKIIFFIFIVFMILSFFAKDNNRYIGRRRRGGGFWISGGGFGGGGGGGFGGGGGGFGGGGASGGW